MQQTYIQEGAVKDLKESLGIIYIPVYLGSGQLGYVQ